MEIRVVRISMAGLKTLRTEEVICHDSHGTIQTPERKERRRTGSFRPGRRRGPMKPDG